MGLWLRYKTGWQNSWVLFLALKLTHCVGEIRGLCRSDPPCGKVGSYTNLAPPPDAITPNSVFVKSLLQPDFSWPDPQQSLAPSG